MKGMGKGNMHHHRHNDIIRERPENGGDRGQGDSESMAQISQPTARVDTK